MARKGSGNLSLRAVFCPVEFSDRRSTVDFPASRNERLYCSRTLFPLREAQFPHPLFRGPCAECGERVTLRKVSTASSKVFVFICTTFLKRVPLQMRVHMHFGQSFHFSAGNGYCCYLYISYISLKAVGIAVWVPASALCQVHHRPARCRGRSRIKIPTHVPFFPQAQIDKYSLEWSHRASRFFLLRAVV